MSSSYEKAWNIRAARAPCVHVAVCDLDSFLPTFSRLAYTYAYMYYSIYEISTYTLSLRPIVNCSSSCKSYNIRLYEFIMNNPYKRIIISIIRKVMGTYINLMYYCRKIYQTIMRNPFVRIIFCSL